ncbi:2-keto-4-pentenoate hydratase [Arenibaculum pallidiluteum]|uniref:2-keto-4-pentenoate hydratase n=1 Tax=Arenibaculum pallidiluteum TaxID=2812559 RepID=UPI001A971F9A|nr:fumarylacetoacetate hydrolase family protein [Arenibaculum pallidiluteum]
MKEEARREAARLIADLRLRRGIRPPRGALPPELRPADLAEGYAVQAEARGLIAAGLGRPAGWKVGSTSPGMQAFLGIPYPCAGTLYANRVRRGEARVALQDFFRLGLECEVAVRLGPGIGGAEPEPAALLRHVEAVMTSIEIVEWRWAEDAEAGVATLVADDFFSAGCVLGPDADPVCLAGDAGFSGRMRLDGVERLAGPASAILGHPLRSLAWLAEHLRAQGTPLAPGEVVTLGAVAAPLVVEAPGRVVASFDGLGEVAVVVT